MSILLKRFVADRTSVRTAFQDGWIASQYLDLAYSEVKFSDGVPGVAAAMRFEAFAGAA